MSRKVGWGKSESKADKSFGVKNNWGKTTLLQLLLAFVFVVLAVGGGAMLLNQLGIIDINKVIDLPQVGGSSFGKAEIAEVTQEDLKLTEKWGVTPLNQMVVVLEDTESVKLAETIAAELNGQIIGEIAYLNLYQIGFEALQEGDFNAHLEKAQNTPGVETAFPNVINLSKAIQGNPCTPLTDPVFESSENSRAYEMIGMKEAWAIIKASKVKLNGVKVGVLDSAMYTGSTEGKGKVSIVGDTTDEPEKDDSGTVVDDGLNHGTMVTHVIGADPDNAGVTGVAGVLGDKLTINVKNLYDGVNLNAPGAVIDPNAITVGTRPSGASATLKALVYLQQQVASGAKVINCSYGPEKPGENNQWINAAYQKFFKKMAVDHPDVIFVAAAGNEAHVDGAINSTNYYPAGIPLSNVVTVGALNNDGTKASFSNFATGDGEVTLSAPGVSVVMGVDEDGQPVKSSGTSFATPQVTATIAIMQSINPKLTAEELKAFLVKSSQPGTINAEQSIMIPQGMGSGLLRVDQAVLAVINDMRLKENKEPLTYETLMNQTTVDLSAKGGGKKFVVTAVLPEVAEGSATVTISVMGQYAMVGDSSQSVGANEEASWEIELADPSVFVKVVRSDTDSCATMTLNQGDYEGQWESELLITEDTLMAIIIQMIGESIEQMGEDMGCEVSETGETYTVIGQTMPMVLNIVKADEEGTFYYMTMINEEAEEEGLDLSGFANNMEGELLGDGSVQFSTQLSEEGMTAYLDINTLLKDEKTIEGTFKLYFVGTTEGYTFTADNYMAGTLTGTKIDTE